MPKIQIRRGTAQALENIIPDVGEPFYVTDEDKFYVGDGSTAISSIKSLAKSDFSNIDNTANALMTHNAMPSTTGTALTVGASGASYQMTDDGWLLAGGNNSQATVAYVQLYNSTSGITNACWVSATGNAATTFIPVSKGDTVLLYYYQFASVGLTFIKANGNS